MKKLLSLTMVLVLILFTFTSTYAFSINNKNPKTTAKNQTKFLENSLKSIEKVNINKYKPQIDNKIKSTKSVETNINTLEKKSIDISKQINQLTKQMKINKKNLNAVQTRNFNSIINSIINLRTQIVNHRNQIANLRRNIVTATKNKNYAKVLESHNSILIYSKEILNKFNWIVNSEKNLLTALQRISTNATPSSVTIPVTTPPASTVTSPVTTTPPASTVTTPDVITVPVTPITSPTN